jgi:hypothetical protein
MAYFSPYIPAHLRTALDDSRSKVSNLNDLRRYSGIPSITSSYFRYDPSGYPLKNTQQLNVDWSKFENHVFFSSAESKVGAAFDQIINGFPFDGTKEEMERFLDKITGFEKHILDRFPKYKGQLRFSNSWIEVNDSKGAAVGSLSREETGTPVLNPPSDTSLSLEFQIFVPDDSFGKQVIFQKSSKSDQGFGVYLDGDNSIIHWIVASGSQFLSTSHAIEKNKFSHITAILNRESDNNFCELFIDEKLVSRSPNVSNIRKLDIDSSLFLIGSGSLVKFGSNSFTPDSTLNATLDELRIFHSIRNKKQQQLFAKKSIFSTPDLKLYYKFNEPPPPLSDTPGINTIVLDSSGNSLHSFVTNFNSSLREDASLDEKSLMTYEKMLNCPVLFPSHPNVIALSAELILSASSYDRENPNLITKLVPVHYLTEGSSQEGKLPPHDADDYQSYGGTQLSQKQKITSSQVVISFLYIWAKFFDEIKIFIDSFGHLNFVDYEKLNNSPDTFLTDMVKRYGFYLPKLFEGGTLEQYIDGENINDIISTSEISLKDLQNDIIRRVLINMPDIIKSKGTKHSIQAFLRATGIDPDNSFKIREFGGPTTQHISYSREKKSEPSHMLRFDNTSIVLSPFLSASRIEPGYPLPSGNFNPDGISDSPDDGLLTSGSWTVEGIYKFDQVSMNDLSSITQSLSRLCVGEFTGENPWQNSSELDNSLIMFNMVAIKDTYQTKLRLHIRPGSAEDSPSKTIELVLPIDSIFDGEKWNIAYGCKRNDSIKSAVSSSYFIKAGFSSEGEIESYYSTEEFFLERIDNESISTRKKSTSSSQNFLAIGTNHLIGVSDFYLGYNDASFDDASTTNFDGQLCQFRFWSKSLDDIEFKEHIRNYKSTGVEDPLKNYNFVTTESGSFERLRINSIGKQENKFSDISGNISFLDHSQNEMHLSGSGFLPESRVLFGELFGYSYLSPKFDESATDEKIRIRGFLNSKNAEKTPWASYGPAYEIRASERPVDDPRLSIEFSLTDALNRDIITLLSSFNFMENAIGSPELIYSPDYPDLEKLREVYFQRLGDKINFQGFFEFFRWFEQSIGRFIEQLIPRKTQFKGTNYVVESHLLERNKLEYQIPEIYLMESDRNRLRDVLLLQQISGILRRY